MGIVETVATNIKKYREISGLSQEGLAELTDLHRTYISDIERCRRNITIKKIELISTALNIEPYKLFLSEGVPDDDN